MVEVDFDKLIEYSDELKTYDGGLPLLIRAIIMKQHSKHLMNLGLYDTIMSEYAQSKPHTYTEAVKELTDWCSKNTDYKDIIKKIK